MTINIPALYLALFIITAALAVWDLATTRRERAEEEADTFVQALQDAQEAPEPVPAVESVGLVPRPLTDRINATQKH